MNTLFVPSIGLDVTLLERLAQSVDYPIKWKIVLNNGTLGALDKFGADHPDWIVKDSAFGNLGVAGSWNEAAKLFPDESLLLVNEDVIFLQGQLELLCSTSDHNQDAPIIFCNDTKGFYCFVWHAIAREVVGTFDENFWPAYYEDCDYRIRMRLLGVEQRCRYAMQGLTPVLHGKPKSGGDNYSAMLQGCGLFNRAFWLRKWGSVDMEKATYDHPYRDHRLSPKDWVWYPEERAKRFPLWDTFINQPNPSIYE